MKMSHLWPKSKAIALVGFLEVSISERHFWLFEIAVVRMMYREELVSFIGMEVYTEVCQPGNVCQFVKGGSLVVSHEESFYI